jgi:hypothetical protein
MAHFLRIAIGQLILDTINKQEKKQYEVLEMGGNWRISVIDNNEFGLES